MSFAAFLNAVCTIQAKTLNTSGYEQVASWTTVADNVPTRMDRDNSAKIEDTNIRINTDDNLFFFNPTVTVERGNRIVLEGKNYDVIKVNKLYRKVSLHHLEVVGRLTDHD